MAFLSFIGKLIPILLILAVVWSLYFRHSESSKKLELWPLAFLRLYAKCSG